MTQATPQATPDTAPLAGSLGGSLGEPAPAQAPRATGRDANVLIGANFFAQLADQLSLTAIPLIAVLHLGIGAGGVGMINAFQTLPYFLLAIPLGVLVDRVSKRGVMLVTELVRIGALLAILALVALDRVDVVTLAIFGFLAAFGSVGFNAALPAYLPALVERNRLAFYNGRLEIVRSTSLIVGPAAAGALAAWFGASNVFILGIVLTCLTIVFVANISRSGRVEPAGGAKKSPLRDIADGASFIVRNRQLTAIMLVAFVWNCGWFALQAAFMPLAINSWGLSAEVVGFALACMGFGLLAGSLLSARIIAWLGFGASLAFGPVLSFVAALVVLANVQYETAYLPALAFFLFGFGPVIWVITSNTLRQVITPGHMLGCVSAMYLTANWGARPFGALVGAAVGATWGEVMCLVLAVGLFLTQMLLVFVTGLFRSALTVEQTT